MLQYILYGKGIKLVKNLYSQVLLEHYRNPRNYGVLPIPSFITQLKNPSCGDSVQLSVQLEKDRVIAIAFQGTGCILSQAATSLLTEEVLNKTIREILALTANDMRRLVTIEVGPLRQRCITLALEALHEGIQDSIDAKKP